MNSAAFTGSRWQCAHCLIRVLALMTLAKTRMHIGFAGCVGAVSGVSTAFHEEGKAVQAIAARRGRGAVQPFARLDGAALHRTYASTNERANAGAVRRLLKPFDSGHGMPQIFRGSFRAVPDTGRYEPEKALAAALSHLLTFSRRECRRLDI